MNQITDGSTVTFTFKVLLIQKQCVDITNSNNFNQLLTHGTECLEETT